MALADEALTLAELADRTGVSERTIRYYIQFGLLPAPEGAGPKTRYSRNHLGRLRLIRMLQDRHLPLSEIRKVLAQHSDQEIEKMAEEPAARSRSSGRAAMSAQFRLSREALEQRSAAQEARSHWERISIAPDIELHVRRPLSKPDNRRLEELLKRIRELFPEGNTQ